MSILDSWRSLFFLIGIINHSQALLSNKNQDSAGGTRDSGGPRETAESETNPEFSGIPDQVFEKYFQNVLAREFAAEYKARQASKVNAAPFNSWRSGPMQKNVIQFSYKHNSVTRAPTHLQFSAGEGAQVQKPDLKRYRSNSYLAVTHTPRLSHSMVYNRKPTVTPQKPGLPGQSQETPHLWFPPIIRPIRRKHPSSVINKLNLKRSMPNIGQDYDQNLDQVDAEYLRDSDSSIIVTDSMSNNQRIGNYNPVQGHPRKYSSPTLTQIQGQRGEYASPTSAKMETQRNEYSSPTSVPVQMQVQPIEYPSPTSAQMEGQRHEYPSRTLEESHRSQYYSPTSLQAKIERSQNPASTLVQSPPTYRKKYAAPTLLEGRRRKHSSTTHTFSSRNMADEPMRNSVPLYTMYRPNPQRWHSYEEPVDGDKPLYIKRSRSSFVEPSSRVSIYPRLATFLISSDRRKRNSNIFEQYSAEEDPKYPPIPSQATETQTDLMPYQKPRNPTVIRFSADNVQDMPRSFRTALVDLLKARRDRIEELLAGDTVEGQVPATEEVQDVSTPETIASAEIESMPSEVANSNEDRLRSPYVPHTWPQPDDDDDAQGNTFDLNTGVGRQFQGFRSSIAQTAQTSFEQTGNDRSVQGSISGTTTNLDEVSAPEIAKNPAPPLQVKNSNIGRLESLKLHAPPTFAQWKVRMASIPKRYSSSVNSWKTQNKNQAEEAAHPNNPTPEIIARQDSSNIHRNAFSEMQRLQMPVQTISDSTEEIIVDISDDSTLRSDSFENDDDQAPLPVTEQPEVTSTQATTESVHPAVQATTSAPVDSTSSLATQAPADRITEYLNSFPQDLETKGQTEAPVEPPAGSRKVKRSVEEVDDDPRAMTFSMMDGDSKDFYELSPKTRRRAFPCSVNTRMGREACHSICKPEGMAVICAGPYCNCFRDTKDESADAERNSGKCGPNTNFGRSNCRTLCNGVDDLITCSEVNCYCNRHKNVNKGNPLMDGMGRLTTSVLGQFFYCGPANGINQCSDICRGWGHVSCGELSCYCDRGGS